MQSVPSRSSTVGGSSQPTVPGSCYRKSKLTGEGGVEEWWVGKGEEMWGVEGESCLVRTLYFLGFTLIIISDSYYFYHFIDEIIGTL